MEFKMMKTVPKLLTKKARFEIEIKTHGIYCSPFCKGYMGGTCDITGDVLTEDRQVESGARMFFRCSACINGENE